ncbi:YeeE/YedE family protein [Calderihabitans maritimus]|uniref:Uncharacterized protein n=1 Tax=Calderihabitans maritimus TaxID=1246530 RepID=A0A1Z5HPC0_9FIRM|nr:YeeE/YedE family protein [Calderihabitans maritimus]GAW91227.1 hypothetical protein Moth_0449 [Calderihabitans maritimus]
MFLNSYFGKLSKPVASGIFILITCIWLLTDRSLGLLWLFGAGFGIIMQRSRFCLAAPYRDLFLFRSTSLLKGLILILIITTAGFAIIQFQTIGFDSRLPSYFKPVGWFTVAGALLFGMGMVLAGACVAGSLVRLGEGHVLYVGVLAGVVAGSLVGAYHFGWWTHFAVQKLPRIFLPHLWGWSWAVGGQLVLLLGVFGLLSLYEIRKERQREASSMVAAASESFTFKSLGRKPWPVWLGAVTLALLNILLLYVHGYPWCVAKVFTFIGGHIGQLLGLGVNKIYFFQLPFARQFLQAGLLNNPIFVLDVGTVFGSFLAAVGTGEFRLRWVKIPRQALLAIAGGVLMGYGARIAMGCTVGAVLSGVSSMSLHGWLFMTFLFPGAYVGTRLLLRYLV